MNFDNPRENPEGLTPEELGLRSEKAYSKPRYPRKQGSIEKNLQAIKAIRDAYLSSGGRTETSPDINKLNPDGTLVPNPSVGEGLSPLTEAEQRRREESYELRTPPPETSGELPPIPRNKR